MPVGAGPGERPHYPEPLGLSVGEVELPDTLARVRERDPHGRAFPSAISCPDWSLTLIVLRAMGASFRVDDVGCPQSK